MSKQIQFELWKECNSKCSWCYLGQGNGLTDSSIKIYNMNNAIKVLSNDELYKEYDTVAFIGGEFFQGQLNDNNVKTKFFELMNFTKVLLLQHKIKTVWISATLTIGDQIDMYNTLDIFKDTPGEIWILTSYDTMGRFHTKKMEDNWKYHMNKLKTEYKWVKTNITTIITGDLILKYLNNEFTFNDFSKEYNSSMFIKLCALPEGMYNSKQEANESLGYFFPKRTDFIKFLIKFKNQEPFELFDKLFNIKYRADTLYGELEGEVQEMYRDKDTIMETYNDKNNLVKLLNCGHLSFYNPYIDSDKCALCDKHNIENMKS